MENPVYSILIPIKDEQDNIRRLYNEINKAMEHIDHPWECVWIDDGSTDSSLSILKEISKKDKNHHYISFEENCGQSAALFAGFKLARGDIFITIDGDGQNDPQDFPRLLQIMNEMNVDMVNGYRKKRQDSIIRKISSKIGNFVRNLITGKTVRDVGCSTRAFKRTCVENLPPFKGMHRFLPTLIHYQGFSWTEIPVNHRPRERGVSKYNISNRLWVGILDLFGVWWFKKRIFFYKIKESTLYPKGASNGNG